MSDRTYQHHLLALLTVLGFLLSLVGLAIAGHRFRLLQRIKDLEERLDKDLKDRGEKYEAELKKYDAALKNQSGEGDAPKAPNRPFEGKSKEAFLASVEKPYNDQHMKMVGVKRGSTELEIVGGALKKLTPAVVWGGLGLLFGTLASVLSLYVG
jgi:hypothetical protein